MRLARDGVVLGDYDIRALKDMASNGQVMESDHLFVSKYTEWRRIREIPEVHDILYPKAAIIDDVPPPPMPDVIAVQSAPIVLVESTANQDVPEELFHGYPMAYWKAYFGTKTYWYIQKFKGLSTPESDSEFKRKAQARMDAKGGLLKHLQYKEELKKNSANQYRPTLVGFLFGWMWLAYRKYVAIFWIYPLLSFVISLMEVGASGHSARENGRNWGRVILFYVVGLFVIPGVGGVKMLHSKAIKVFVKSESFEDKFEDRILWIRDQGGTSWWWVIGYICFAVVFDLIIEAVITG